MLVTRNRRLVAVSGLGSIARQHVAEFNALGDVDVIAFDPSQELRDAALATSAVQKAFTTFADLLKAEPDALVIAAPDFAHLEQLDLATSAGITTLVEKPLSDNYKHARELLPRIEQRGVPVLVGYVLRHRKAVEETRRLVFGGAIGTPTSFQVMLGAYGTITAAASRFSTAEDNRLYRDYSHEWDYIRWIFGPIREVLAVARTTDQVPHMESPNLVDGLLLLEANIAGAFHIDYADKRGTRTLHIIGTDGSIFADIGEGTVTVRRAGRADTEFYDFTEPPSSPLSRQAAHLLSVAAGAESPRIVLQDGLAALAVTDALIHSATTRSWTPVDGSTSA